MNRVDAVEVQLDQWSPGDVLTLDGVPYMIVKDTLALPGRDYRLLALKTGMLIDDLYSEDVNELLKVASEESEILWAPTVTIVRDLT